LTWVNLGDDIIKSTWVNLGDDLNKSTWVNLGKRSRVKTISLCAIDPPTNWKETFHGKSTLKFNV